MRPAVRVVIAIWLVHTIAACTSGRNQSPQSRVPSGWPIAHATVTVTAEFGATRGRSRHEGIDLAAPPGTDVWATADGKVLFAGRDGRYGRTVVIDHRNGYRTRYAHLKRIDTRVGSKVRRGDVIGRVGSSGNASGPHLHYEVIRNGVPVNPRPYLD